MYIQLLNDGVKPYLNANVDEIKQFVQHYFGLDKGWDIKRHYQHLTPVTENDKYHLEACENDLPDGTYELCGEKVQGNPENIVGHVLIPHGKDVLDITDLSFEWLCQYLEVTDIEGIVFHDKLSDKMCKIRKSDFGIKR